MEKHQIEPSPSDPMAEIFSLHLGSQIQDAMFEVLRYALFYVSAEEGVARVMKVMQELRASVLIHATMNSQIRELLGDNKEAQLKLAEAMFIKLKLRPDFKNVKALIESLKKAGKL